jgi:hypothetical protein
MGKRFTDTNKYKKPFIRGLQEAYKVLWDYLYHDCDHAGIWIVDFEVAQIYVGADLPINKKDALKYFNESEKRIVEIDCGNKWFIPSFIEFQYGELNEQNRAHNSVIKILKNKGLLSSLQGAKDMDKDKVKELEKEQYKDKPKKNLSEDVNENEIVNKISYKKELLQYLQYLTDEHDRSIGHMQVEQTLKMLDSWYKTDDQKKQCLSSNIANNWKTLNHVDVKQFENKDWKQEVENFKL